MVAFHDIFSVVAFFIFLRETLEASVIIAVLLQCMNRTMPRLKRQGEQRGIHRHLVCGSAALAFVL
jgi:high-affinity Fe2+/Pb2+ permease